MTYKTDDELQGLLMQEQNTGHPPKRPPWSIRIYKKSGSDGAITAKESAVFLRFHHSIADGTNMYATLLPLLFDLKPVLNCNNEFLSTWKRSEGGLTQVARVMDLHASKRICVRKETESLLDVERCTHNRKTDQAADPVTCKGRWMRMQSSMRLAAGYISWIFFVAYEVLR
jgi:hypothetical protein